MLRKKSRWSLIFPAQIHHAWLLEGNNLSQNSCSPYFIYAFSLKEHAFHRMFFRNESEVYFWLTMPLFCYLAVEASSFCWLFSMPALQRGWQHLNIQVCNVKKLPLHLQCACCRACKWTKEHRTGQTYRLQKASLTVNVTHGNTVAILKGGLKRKTEQEMPADTSDAVENSVAWFDSLLRSGIQRHYTSRKGVWICLY